MDNNTTNPLDPTGSLTGSSKLGNVGGYDLNGSNIIFTANPEEGPSGDVNVFKTTTSGGAPVALLAFQPNTPAGIPFFSFQAVKLGGQHLRGRRHGPEFQERPLHRQPRRRPPCA